MKKFASLFLILVAILAIAPVTNAQFGPLPEVAECNAPFGFTDIKGPTVYRIVEKDTLYCMSPSDWRDLQAANPKLGDSWRIGKTKSGLYRVHLSVDETINVPSGMTVRIPRTGPPNVEPQKPADTTQTPTAAPTAEKAGLDWLGWLILAMLIASVVVLARVLRTRRLEREKRRPVETAGPPMVPGGIRPNQTTELRNFFDEQARARFAELRPNYHDQAAMPTRIGPIEHGMIGGEGEVRDIQGNWHPRRVDPPQPGYQARFRFPDGTEEIMQAYEVCMNIVRRGEGMRGFTFTPRAEAVAAPEPERPGPQTLPHPAIAVRTLQTAAQQRGNNTFTVIGGETMEFPQGYHGSIDPETGEFSLTAASFVMKVKPKRQRAKSTRTTTRAVTGTDGN